MLRDAGLKFTRELSAKLVIRSVSETVIRVNDDDYSESIALTPDGELHTWADKPIADLVETDFDTVVETKPEIVILGTGASNIFPPRDLTFAFARKGVGLEVMDTPAAARTYNVLANEGRRIATILYL